VSLSFVIFNSLTLCQGASGKAGGLVAKWAYPDTLTRVSFDEHVKLAEEFNGATRWGWRWTGVGEWAGRGAVGDGERVSSGSNQTTTLKKKAGLPSTRAPSAEAQEKGLPDDLTWVNAELTDTFESMAPPGDTAQVHPYLFTTSMLDLAVERGVQSIRGRVTAIESTGGKVTGVQYVDPDSGAEARMPADYVVLAAGAWSPTLLPKLPVSGTRAHSIVIRPPPDTPADAVSPYVLFTNIRLPNARKAVTPEVYPRPNPEIYVCGPGDTRVPLPPTVDDVEVDARACEEIWEWVAKTGVLEPWTLGEVAQRQACYLPVASAPSGGGPIIGTAPGTQGLIIATGHTCWVCYLLLNYSLLLRCHFQGICNAPGTAKAVAELVLESHIKCANLEALNPARYM
jgi:glycine/D-amino acid oxidase-like deaminating enzyme